MKIDLFNVEEFIKVNNLKEITSPILFQRGDIPHPEGLISNEIFGITTKSRKETYAYIDLHGYFFHPHIYKAIRRMFRNIDTIVNGQNFYSLDKDGRLVLDNENGQTGLSFLYDNWEKINWTKSDDKTSNDSSSNFGMRYERENLLKDFKKNEIFMHYQIVIPAFYRDITSTNSGGETDNINNLYAKLIRSCKMLDNQNLFSFQFDTTNFNIQSTIVDIYDYFKHKVEKKNGLIRKYLMGKSVDFSTRTVITAPTFHADKPDDLFVTFEYSSIPMAQACSLAYPFVMHYVKKFFEQEVVDTQIKKLIYDPETDKIANQVSIVNPEAFFSDKYIKKMIDTFIKDPESRFNKIEVPTDHPKKHYYLAFTGMRTDATTTQNVSGIGYRALTWTDLLYMACENVTKNMHCLITRYPINDEFGIFMTKIRIASTSKTVPMEVNGYLYKWYPVIDNTVPANLIGSKFIDAVQFSNSYLPGIEGDYDGDQTTVKFVFTQEANEECEKNFVRKSNFINSSGSNIRTVGKEVLQTYFVLTKDPYGEYKALTNDEKKYFLSLTKKDMTFTNLVKWFGNTIDETKEKTEKNIHSRFNVCDTLTLTSKEYPLIKGNKQIKTTIGRFIFNKMLIEDLGFSSFMDYQNIVMTKGNFNAHIDNVISSALKDDIITTKQMIAYIDTRDWLGLQLHGVITSSFTPGVLMLPKSVTDLKKKLMSENEEAIKNGDARVIEDIEQQLIKKTKEALKDDIGMDLYNSGARGSVNNHLKNMMLTRGAVQNPVTKEYDIIENSLMDGLAKKDIPAHSNMITSGAYPKAVLSVPAAYKLRELLEHRNFTAISSEDLKIIFYKLDNGIYNNVIINIREVALL